MDEHATPEVQPSQVVSMALAEDSFGIAYTYNEPLVGIEYVLDCGALARGKGLKNVLVTNGYVNAGPARDILAITDALNLDIKGMDPSFYTSLCRGTLGPVLDFARQAVSAGCHVEITCLLIPGHNDRVEQVRALAAWIRDNLGVGVPLHLSAYHPQYRMAVPPTGVAVLRDACKCAREALSYVYVGNVPGSGWADTACPGCGHTLVKRRGSEVAIEGVDGGCCAHCRRAVDMVLG
jgi:pyruvate formate lyase activating enzyme